MLTGREEEKEGEKKIKQCGKIIILENLSESYSEEFSVLL